VRRGSRDLLSTSDAWPRSPVVADARSYPLGIPYPSSLWHAIEFLSSPDQRPCHRPAGRYEMASLFSWRKKTPGRREPVGGDATFAGVQAARNEVGFLLRLVIVISLFTWTPVFYTTTPNRVKSGSPNLSALRIKAVTSAMVAPA